MVLNRTYESNSKFLKKKLTRITLPYLLYVLLSIAIMIIINKTPIDLNTLKFYFIDVFIGYGIGWYFWMMIGVYFAIPIINEYIKNKQLEGARYFLIIAIFSIIIYSIFIIFNIKNYLDLVFFLGPVTYLFIGFYCHHKQFQLSNNKLFIIGILLFSIPFILRLISYPSTTYYFIFLNIDSINLMTFLDVSIFGIMEYAGLFLIFKAIDSDNPKGVLNKIKKFYYTPPIKKFNLSISKSSYGMYLSHMYLLVLLYALLPELSLSGSKTFICILIISIIIFILAWITVLIVNKIPYLKQFSGYA